MMNDNEIALLIKNLEVDFNHLADNYDRIIGDGDHIGLYVLNELPATFLTDECIRSIIKYDYSFFNEIRDQISLDLYFLIIMDFVSTNKMKICPIDKNMEEVLASILTDPDSTHCTLSYQRDGMFRMGNISIIALMDQLLENGNCTSFLLHYLEDKVSSTMNDEYTKNRWIKMIKNHLNYSISKMILEKIQDQNE